eukprot:CAMPEP_0181256884 /NCGR_PEP_ID=MMETSP1096-20121128/49954_1 /TAXON_ID=156174 ORGANISM="Chrysochromulina ericina, Strain CCMP281" /NCGR_SAMPLE_ID=MMETSP1096 /ASSEMBLY_ACC=CAM_ASM_000453 /LENGTH=40 /DNA_ID= /DNA_START= /DNA_END= /DNA_ORIENTATION=
MLPGTAGVSDRKGLLDLALAMRSLTRSVVCAAGTAGAAGA